MRTTWIGTALGIGAILFAVGVADAKQTKKKPAPKKAVVKKTAAKPSGAETGLVGIKLYDTGARVISLYGTPDDIQPAGGGGGAVGGGGGAGGPGGPSGFSGKGAGGGGGAATAGPPIDYTAPFSLGDDTLYRQSGMTAGPPTDAAPPAGGAGGNTGSGGGMGPGGGSGGGGERILYTRWIFNRSGSKYGFILDKFNRVVQIEAIGLQNQKVRTRSGIGFGSTFAKIIRAYGAPDGYEINGNNIVVRYLVRKKVAFRLNRLGKDKPHVVTAVVVSAGKA